MVLAMLDEFLDPWHRLVEGVRRNEAKDPRYPQRIIGPLLGLVGQAKKSVKDAGGGSVSHIASIAAIFIFWLSVAV